jgi:hypothetical protein
MRRTCTEILVGLVVLCFARSSSAVFHETLIDELMTSYGGDPNVQFIEMRMLASLQNFVGHSVFAAFDSNGTYINDILVVPGNLTHSGSGTRWLIGTAAFQTNTGLAPDFVMPAGILPTGGGMVCFGGGGGISPQNPPNWDRTNFASYVDCVAYGTFTGTGVVTGVTPTALNGDGHSLQRMGDTKDNAADFTCANPATPQNNAGTTASMAATSPCAGVGPSPTPTTLLPTATPKPMPTGSQTPTITPTRTAAPTSIATATLTAAINTHTPTPTSSATATPTTIATPTTTLTASNTPTASSTPPNTPTATGTPNASPTATPACVGDCGGSGVVNISDLITGVNIALGNLPVSACPAFENAQGKVDIAQLIKGVNNALEGCGRG